jgi:hypothetical protein
MIQCFPPLAGQHQHKRDTGGAGGEQIAVAVADGIAVFVVREETHRFEKESGLWLAASAAVVRSVRARENGVDPPTRQLHLLTQMKVNVLQFLAGYDAASNDGLIGHDDDPSLVLGEQAQGVEGAGQELILLSALDVFGPVFVDHTVAIKQDEKASAHSCVIHLSHTSGRSRGPARGPSLSPGIRSPGKGHPAKETQPSPRREA